MFMGSFQSLKARHFNESLAQKSVTTMKEIMTRVECYIKMDESNAKKWSRDVKERGCQSQNLEKLGTRRLYEYLTLHKPKRERILQ